MMLSGNHTSLATLCGHTFRCCNQAMGVQKQGELSCYPPSLLQGYYQSLTVSSKETARVGPLSFFMAHQPGGCMPTLVRWLEQSSCSLLALSQLLPLHASDRPSCSNCMVLQLQVQRNCCFGTPCMPCRGVSCRFAA